MRSFELVLAVAMAMISFAAAGSGTVTQSIEIKLESEPFGKRGEVYVTQADFDAFLSRVPEVDRAGVLASPERIGDIFKDLLLTRQLAAEARAAGTVDDPALQAALYQSAMVAIAEYHVNAHVDQHELADYEQLAREYWLTGRYRPHSPRTADFTHLLVSDDGQSVFDAALVAAGLYERLEQGETLDALIEQGIAQGVAHSESGSVKAAELSELEQSFADALTNLDEAGAVSRPVLTRFGWHIVRLDALHEPADLSYEEALPRLLRYARERHRAELAQRLRAELSGQPMSIEEGAVRALLERYGLHSPDDRE